MNRTAAFTLASLLLSSSAVWAKLPPLSDEAKAKAAETAAKTAHTAKVDSYKLCKSMDAVAGRYAAEARKQGKTVKPTAGLAPCADPGAFVYPPPATPAAAAPAAPAKTLAAAPAAAPVKK
ncbi:MAG: hypothetical protein ACKO8N_00460 [Rubrivivax sp.]